MGSVCN